MAITIADPEIDRLARQVSALTGETVADAVKAALRARLEALQPQEDEAVLIARMKAIGRKCARHMDKPFSSLDHGDLLYDENGLPE